jgi:hypothetical protein
MQDAPGVVRRLDRVPARAGRTGAARAQGSRGLPPHDYALEPLEGPQEAGRLAAVPGYCFVRFNGAERLPVLKCTGVVNIVSFDGDIAPIPEQRDREHPAAGRERSAVRSLSAHP